MERRLKTVPINCAPPLEDLAARLERLREDDIESDEARQLQLRGAQERAIKAEMRASEANAQRGSFGNSVDKFKVEAARREAVRLAEEARPHLSVVWPNAAATSSTFASKTPKLAATS